ncbi:MAG: hypothetical protein AB1589_12215 [Cyanobacteriota bacterium]
MYYSFLPIEGHLSGRIGDYWLENGEVKYEQAEWVDTSPNQSSYTRYEQVTTIKTLFNPPESLLERLIARQESRSAFAHYYLSQDN